MFPRLLVKELGNPTPFWGGLLARLWNRHNRALNDTALKELDLTPTNRVLEIGIGGGYLLKRLGQAVIAGNLAGVDISPAMIAFCKQRLVGVDLHTASVEKLPFPSQSFHKAVSVNSIFYWRQPLEGLVEIRRILVGGGVLVIVFTDPSSLKNRPFANGGIHMFSGEDVSSLFQAAGYTLHRLTRHEDGRRKYWSAVSRVNS